MMRLLLSYFKGYREGLNAREHVRKCPSCRAKNEAWQNTLNEIIQHAREAREYGSC